MIRKPTPPPVQSKQTLPKQEDKTKEIHVSPRVKHFFWQGKLLPAFWTVASVVSLFVNLVLIIVLISLGKQLFEFKKLIEGQLIGGLYNNFVLMDKAHIITDINVDASIPIRFDLPVSSNTTVYLTKDTKIPNTWVALNTAGQGINLSINAPADITLPEGTPLDIQLTLMVPVSTTVPVSLPVHVDIPLNQTELHQPFTGLQSVVRPYRDYLGGLPDTWEETVLCTSKADWFCQKLFGTSK
jgi:hypothetical protein